MYLLAAICARKLSRLPQYHETYHELLSTSLLWHVYFIIDSLDCIMKHMMKCFLLYAIVTYIFYDSCTLELRLTLLYWFFLLNLSTPVAADGNEPVQIKLHKSLRLWTFYVDLEESLGTLESTRAVYERILDLRIATPQIIINYAMLLEVWKPLSLLFL